MSDELGVDRQEAVDELPHPAFGHRDFVFDVMPTTSFRECLPGSTQQDKTEDHADPFESLEQLEATQDEQESEDDCAGDAVVEHPSFECLGGVEAGEDEAHHEQVVERQRLLDGPRRQVFATSLGADEDEHRDGEQECRADVDDRPIDGLTESHLVVLLGVEVLDDGVDDEDSNDDGVHEPRHVEGVDV